MTENYRGISALRVVQLNARESESLQIADTKEIALHGLVRNPRKSGADSDANSTNSKPDNEMRPPAQCAENSSLRNTMPVNHLCGLSDENTAGKAPKNLFAGSMGARWCKFNLVGGMGVVVQFAALFFLKSVLHFNYLGATAIAVEAAVVHNFVWHEQFTWADRFQSKQVHTPWRRPLLRFVRFNLSNGSVSILVNLALMKVMVGVGHLNYLLANAIAIALCSIANFLVSERWVFVANE